MLLYFTFFMSGIMFAFRISEKLVQQRLIAVEAMTKIGTAYLFCELLAVIFLPAPGFVTISLILHSFLWLAQQTLTHWRVHRFQRKFLLILDQVILGMSSGLSFRQSFESAKNRMEPIVQQQLAEIMGHVAFSQQKSSSQTNEFLRDLIEELTLVDQQPHRALQRLQTLRRKLKMEQNFRRRSGQVTQQLRAQAIILSGMYAFLLIFVSQQIGLSRYLNLTLISLMLFSLGLLFILNIGKRFRWKV